MRAHVNVERWQEIGTPPNFSIFIKAFSAGMPMGSPVLQVYDYRAVQAQRGEMENAIRDVIIDLKTETIKKGSRQALRLTKTQDAFKRELKEWKIDVELLTRMEG